MSKLYVYLKPYTNAILEEYYSKGLPPMRHPYLHYEKESKLLQFKYQYLYGRDLLVAPVIRPHVTTWKVFLPQDNWVHLWTGKEFTGGWVSVPSPIGNPPVFYRKNSEFAQFFAELPARIE